MQTRNDGLDNNSSHLLHSGLSHSSYHESTHQDIVANVDQQDVLNLDLSMGGFGDEEQSGGFHNSDNFGRSEDHNDTIIFINE
jgi:hypothetical protein